MHSTVQSSVYCRLLSSLGVNKKVCVASLELAALVIRLKILRSLIGSMPWLISSTTLNGALVSSWSEMRYSMVLTDLSPPDCLCASRMCMSVTARNLTQI